MKENRSIESDAGLAWQALVPPWQGVAGEISEACARAGIPFGWRALLLCVRDMPYARPAGGQTIAAALGEWRGTCSTKHLALHLLLQQLGLAPRLMMASFLVGPSLPLRDPGLRAAVQETPVHDVHNFLYCRLAARETLVDVTFPRSLAPHGFEVTRDWYPGQDFRLACSPREIREVAADEAIAAKQAWLDELNPGPARALRERVIGDLAATMAGAGFPATRGAAIALTVASL